MNAVSFTEGSRRFHLDEEVMPGLCMHYRFTTTVVYANHGKAIVRNRNGIWFTACITDSGLSGTAFLILSVARGAESVGGDFHGPLILAGTTYRGFQVPFVQDQGLPTGVCLLMDSADRLHVVFSDDCGVRRVTADASGATPYERLSNPDAWSAPECLAGPGAVVGDAAILPDGALALWGVREGVLFEAVSDGTTTEICGRAEHPSVALAADGRRHVAFERDRRIFYTTSADGRAWADSHGTPGDEMVAYFCSSWPSIAVDGRGTVVIAYQGEGKVDLRRLPEMYARLRPGAGGTVSFAALKDERWHNHDLLRSSEILLKRRVSSSLPAVGGKGLFRNHLEEFWRPSLAVDRHGVLWMFFLNTTRRHIYFTRFLGDRFGDHYEARGAYDCPSRVYFVQKESRAQSGLGFIMLAGNQLTFDSLDVPVLTVSPGHATVFLDNLEVDRMSGVEHCVGQWRKRPDPLPFDFSGVPDADRTIVWCQASRTGTGFAMRYMSHKGGERSNWMPGRATSDDGVHWTVQEPADMSRLTLNGGAFPSAFWRPIYLVDEEEPDPQRRYKGLLGMYNYVRGAELRTWVSVTSPDGVAWQVVEGLDPVVVGDISVNGHIFCDPDDRDPERRFKVMMLMGAHAGRAACLFTSPDGIHWHRTVWLREDPDNLASPVSPYPTGPIMLDPDGGEMPWEEEIHDAVLWRENGLLMAHYDAFYFHYNQHTNKALAVSRDGKHFWRIRRGELNMPHGNCGEWDSGRDRSSIPLRVGDELWMYYCGMPASYFADPERVDLEADAWNHPPIAQEVRPWHVGLATLRLDGWAYLQRLREAHAGEVTTIPFDYPGGGLVVNGAGLDGVSVEVRTADDTAAVPGFEGEGSAFSTDNSVAAEAFWAGGEAPPPGRYRLRFTLRGVAAKLYAFRFE